MESEQNTTFWVGENARLEYLPDPLIPYAGSRHTQRTRIHLDAGAASVLVGNPGPRPAGFGRAFAFERLRIESEVSTVNGPLLRENFLLEPGKGLWPSTARMREYSYIAQSLCLSRRPPPGFWRELEDELNEVAASEQRRARPCGARAPGSRMA